VLVPRPETEHLIEAALALDLPERARVLDVGTGSGCLAVTLAVERPGWRVVACDRSIGALALAGPNAAAFDADVRRLATDLLAALRCRSFDLVVANPPYLAASELAALEPEVREHEPRHALVADRDGLALIERLLVEGLDALGSGGWLLCEIGAEQGPRVRRAARDRGWENVELRPDLAGRDRVLVARAPA